MSTPPCAPPNAESPVNLPDELISEILSIFNVKFLIQMKCVCKSWNSIISNPKFVKLHLNRSARNPYSTLYRPNNNMVGKVLPFPERLLIHNQHFINLLMNLCYRFQLEDCHSAIGTCNGLFCVFFIPFLNLEWSGSVSGTLFLGDKTDIGTQYKIAFVYHDSSETCKVVMLTLNEPENRTHVQVLSVGDTNGWKTIPDFPAVGVYLNGRLNWLAVHDHPVSVYGWHWENVKAKEFVIVSLDMETELYMQLMPPRAFDEMSSVKAPSVCILKDSLCFSHDFRRTEFIIWQMKIVGVEQTWTQNLQTKFHDFADLKNCQLLPLHLSNHNNTLILANNQDRRAILYNLRDNTTMRTKFIEEIQCSLPWFMLKVWFLAFRKQVKPSVEWLEFSYNTHFVQGIYGHLMFFF